MRSEQGLPHRLTKKTLFQEFLAKNSRTRQKSVYSTRIPPSPPAMQESFGSMGMRMGDLRDSFLSEHMFPAQKLLVHPEAVSLFCTGYHTVLIKIV